ncbi:Glyoxalase-like domain containing protein [Naviculisporaceae sp. PSN 640]
MHPVLDHIVLLVPHQTLQNLPSWITDAFTVINGGAHAGGETENKLIVFRDGTYIELIAFVDGLDPEKRKRHRWGSRSEGRIIDWALSLVDIDNASVEERTGNAEVEFKKVQERIREAHTGIEYEEPVAGGRTTPAGVVLKWATSSPVVSNSWEGSADGGIGGGELPFWCLDRTPRPWRVPHLDVGNVTHPSGVTGIAGVTVLFRDAGLLEKVGAVYEAIHGYSSGSTLASHAGSGTREWQFKVPASSEFPGWTLRLDTLSIEHQSAETDVSIDLTFFTEGEPRKIQGTIVDGWEIVFDLVNA